MNDAESYDEMGRQAKTKADQEVERFDRAVKASRHASPAARHVAEKIRNAIRAGMSVDVFGKKRLTGVVLDLESAEEFAKEVGDAKD